MKKISSMLNTRIFSKNNNHGFTFIEILAALSILSVIGASLWSSISYTGRYYHKTDKQAYINRKMLLIDSSLRTNINNVKYPFWLIEKEFTAEDEKISINYYKGIKNSILEIYFSEEKGLVIQSPDKEEIFPCVKELTISLDDDEYENCMVFELLFETGYSKKIAVRLFSDVLGEIK